GVPSTALTAAWVPAPTVISYATGLILIGCGVVMFIRKAAASAAASAGLLMIVLAAGLYVPQFFLGHSVADHVKAINFIFDTLLFGGMMLIIGAAARPRGGDATSRLVLGVRPEPANDIGQPHLVN